MVEVIVNDKPKSGKLLKDVITGEPYNEGANIAIIKGIKKEVEKESKKYKITTTKGSMVIGITENNETTKFWNENYKKFEGKNLRWKGISDMAFGSITIDLEMSKEPEKFKKWDVVLSISGFDRTEGHLVFVKKDTKEIYGIKYPKIGILIGGKRVLSELITYKINSILSSEKDRPKFRNKFLSIKWRQMAAKTWTSTKQYKWIIRANNLWTIWYTPQIATVAWVWNTSWRQLNSKASWLLWAWPILYDFMTFAHENLKNVLIDAKEEDIQLIKSPVGLPARGVITNLQKSIEAGTAPKIACVSNCVVPCHRGVEAKVVGFCIADSLSDAYRGYLDTGLFFTGTNGYKLDKIISVKELMSKLTNGEQ